VEVANPQDRQSDEKSYDVLAHELSKGKAGILVFGWGYWRSTVVSIQNEVWGIYKIY